MRFTIVALTALVLSLGACKPTSPPVPQDPQSPQLTAEVTVQCEEDMPCWVCSPNDNRCDSRKF